MIGKIALLQIARHPIRSALIFLAVLLSVLVMELVTGMMEGMRWSFFQKLASESGHIIIESEASDSLFDGYSLENLIDDYDLLTAELLTDPRVVSVNPVLKFPALAVHGQKNVGMAVHGLDEGTSLYRAVSSYLGEKGFPPNQGYAALSLRSAELLGIDEGTQVMLLVEDIYGSPYYLAYDTVIYETSSRELDENVIFLNIEDARQLSGAEHQVSEIRVMLHQREDSMAVADTYRSLLDLADARGTVWQDAHGDMLVFIRLFDVIMAVINACIVVTAATVIVNAVLMNLFERTGQYGTLRAVGMKKRTMLAMILSEGAVLGAAGSLAALAAGIPLVLYFQEHGLDFGEVTEAMSGQSLYYFRFSPFKSLMNLLFGISITMAASLYAARVVLRQGVAALLRGGQK